MSARLTPAQRRMLAEVERGPRTYNGRAQRTVDALEAAGLVRVEFDLRPHAKGGGMDFSRLLTVTIMEGLRPCSSCGGPAWWTDDAWVCRECGDEWYPDHFGEDT